MNREKRKEGLEGSLMTEGVVMWAVFTEDGKASLYMDEEEYPGNGEYRHKGLPVSNVSALYEVCTPDDTFMFLIFSKFRKRIRIRLRYPGTQDKVAGQPEDEPETCFPVWIMPEKDGRAGLYLQELSGGQCFIPDITGLPGLPELHPGGHPVKLEMLIRRVKPLPEHPEYSGTLFRGCPGRDKRGSLMKEGVLVWIMFATDGKAALYMNNRIHFAGTGQYVPGKLLSPDISAFHEVYDWDEQYAWIRSRPERAVRYRIRFRYAEVEDETTEQSEYEPEACFPAWIMQEKDGRSGLYLREMSAGQCFIPDMTGLPGLPELQPGTPPVRVEMLIRQAHWMFDMANPAFLKTGNPGCPEAMDGKASGETEINYR